MVGQRCPFTPAATAENSGSPSAMCVSVGCNFGRLLPRERRLGRYGETFFFLFFLSRLFFSERQFKQVDLQLTIVSIDCARGNNPTPAVVGGGGRP